jgi:hypothetical protein
VALFAPLADGHCARLRPEETLRARFAKSLILAGLPGSFGFRATKSDHFQQLCTRLDLKISRHRNLIKKSSRRRDRAPC